MKKILCLALAVLLALGMAGCSSPGDGTAAQTETKKLRVVATIFPEYDWLREIVGDDPHVELTLLLDNGVDLHSYQPTADDILAISRCDLFVYVGGESDKWVQDALATAANPDQLAVSLLEALGDAAKEEETVEGMEAEEEEEDEEEPELDEHVWLSLRNASALCGVLAEKLGQLDPEHRADYAANAAAYQEKLGALDRQYQAAVEAAPQKTVLFGDRFPFRYLTDDYGLGYYAAFAGCSAETEASFETVIFLAGKVDELGLSAICQIETSDGSIARTIREATSAKDQEILTLDSLQSTTAKDMEEGASYLGAMEQNLTVLTQALQ